MICRLKQLLMQSNAVIRERERLSAYEYLRLCVSQQYSAVAFLRIFKLNCFKNLDSKKCYVAFQLQNYFIDKYAGQPQL